MLKNKKTWPLLIVCGLLLLSWAIRNPNYIKEDIEHSKLILDRQGEILYLGMTKDEKYRIWEKLDDIDPKFIKRILNKEDKYFYYHFGINPIALLKATKNYLSGNLGPGASTVSMQLARLYYKLNTKTILGKLKQMACSIWIEIRMPKDKILEAYLNLIPTGGNREGIETAARFYFNKPSKELSLIERNFLLEIPQRPQRFNHFLKKNYEFFISKFTKDKELNLTAKEVKSLLDDLKPNLKKINHAPHYSRKLSQLLPNDKIHGSLHKKYQLAVKKLLNNYISSQKPSGIHNGTVLVVDNRTGEILVYIGSNDFYDHSIQGQVDGLKAKRSPGSTLKPFIYGLGIDQGLIIPKSIVFDGPLNFRTPENYDRQYQGEMTVEKALITSRNIPAVEIYAKLNEPGLVEYLTSAGIQLPHEKSYYGAAIALGGAELSSIELATLYMNLANNGLNRQLSHVKVKSERKENSYSNLTDAASVLVKDMLSKNPRPNQKNMDQISEKLGEVYWKTGTSIGFRDAWAVGIWGDYTIVTWFGDFTPRSNSYLTGATMAGPMFFQVVDFLRNENLFQYKSDMHHLVHKDVKEINVCAVSGHRPNEHCPNKVKSLYIPGVSPLKTCLVHQKVLVSKKTGLRSCDKTKGPVESKVIEIYSTNKLKRLESIGLPLTDLPKFGPECTKLTKLKYSQEKPIIISPRIGYTYVIEGNDTTAKVPINLKLFGDSEKASVYIDEKLVKRITGKNEELVDLRSGSYILKVIDDRGRSNSRIINVMDVL